MIGEVEPSLKRVYLVWAACLFAVIAGVSALPTRYKFALHTQGLLHPWLHVFAFGTLTFLLVSGTRSPSLRVVITLLMLTFGWGTEYVEHLRDSWPVESKDVFFDAVGILLGAAVALFRSSGTPSGRGFSVRR